MITAFNRSIVAVVGIDDYTHGIPELHNARGDAAELADRLEERGYEPRRLLDDVTREAMLSFLDDLVDELKPDDRLVFYFAGHGRAPDAPLGKPGCLLTVDADPLGDGVGLVTMDEIKVRLDALRCRHLLVILDCCYAGSFRWASASRHGEILPLKPFREHYLRYTEGRARQVLTSSAHDQKAHDALWGLGDRGQGEHSPFALALFEALDGAADLVPDSEEAYLKGNGLITTTELYAFLRQWVEDKTSKAGRLQTPGLWSLDGHDHGEFVFEVPGREVDLRPAPKLTAGRNPYSGLEAFTRENMDLFFGRGALVEQVVEELPEQPLIALVGASGSGKSSLLQAGVLPRLQGVLRRRPSRPRLDKTEPWRVIGPLRPGEEPMVALQDALAMAGEEIEAEPEEISPETVLSFLEQHPEERWVIAIDQLEELITVASEVGREAFEQFLADWVTAAHPRLRILVTCRVDLETGIEGTQERPRPLRDLWRAGRRIVPSLDHVGLRQVIVGPAGQRALFVEDALVRELIKDVQQMPGALSLLSVTLSELYQGYVDSRRRDRRLTLADYEAAGRVGGSISRRANAVIDRLVESRTAQEAADLRATLQRVMLRMVSLRGQVSTRRRVSLAELDYPQMRENERVVLLLAALEEERLVVPSGDSVEPAHDMLISGWDELQEWIDVEREELVLQRAVSEQSRTWQVGQAGSWWNDPRLTQLHHPLETPWSWRFWRGLQQSWSPIAKHWLNRQELNFYDASLKTRRQRQSALWSSLSIVLIASLFAAWIFYNQNTANRELRYDALTQRLAEQVPRQLTGDDRNAERALLLAVQAEKTRRQAGSGHTARVDEALRRALLPVAPAEVFYRDPDFSLNSLATSPTGPIAAVGSGSRVLLFHLEKPDSEPTPLETGGAIEALAFHPSGEGLAAVNAMGEFCFWHRLDSIDSQPIELADACVSVPEDEISALAFVPAIESWVTAHALEDGGTLLRTWKVGEAGRPTPGTRARSELVFSALAMSGDFLYAVDDDSQVLYRWPADDLEAPPEAYSTTEEYFAPIASLTSRPDGGALIGQSVDGDLVFWRPERVDEPWIFSEGIRGFAFDPEGDLLAVGGFENLELRGPYYAFDLHGSWSVPCFADVSELAFSHKGRHLIVGCGKTLRLWRRHDDGWRLADTTDRAVIDVEADQLAFHPTDPNRLAVTTLNRQIEVWDLAKRSRRSFDRSHCPESLADELVMETGVDGDRVRKIGWDGDRLWAVERDGEMWSFDPAQDQQIPCESEFLGGAVCDAALSPDGVWQASLVGSGYLTLSIRPTGRSQDAQALDGGSVAPRICSGAVAFQGAGVNTPQTPGPRLVGAVGVQLKRWTPPQVEGADWPVETLASFDQAVVAIDGSPDGRWLAAGGAHGQIWVWQTSDPLDKVRLFEVGDAAIESIDARWNRLAVASSDGQVSVWDLDLLDEPPVILGHQVAGTAGWNEDSIVGNQSALVTALGGVVLTEDWIEDDAAERRTRSFSNPRFNADGSLLSVAVEDRGVHLIRFGTQDFAEVACRLVAENLSWQDWNRYVGAGEPYERTCENLPVHPSALEAGDRLAEEGDEPTARAIYRRLVEIQPDLVLDPERRIRAWRFRRLVVSHVVPERSRLEAALAALKPLQDLTLKEEISPVPFATMVKLCLWPTLLGTTESSLRACDWAVDLLPGDTMARDARALTRARKGDLQGATEDFEISRDGLYDENWRSERAVWITELKAGKNPIDDEVIQRLAKEYLGLNS